MADIDNLKADIDKLADTLRKSEKDIYGKIDETKKDVSELNTSVKLIVDKLSTFIETFKHHDTNEMQKYDDIVKMFEKSQTETKKLEEKISEKYITKDEMKNFQSELQETNKTVEKINESVKQGFKIFYIGSGMMIMLSIIGGLIMWILNLISKLQSLGVN